MALTARELAKQKRRDRAERERDLRRKDRVLLAELRKRVQQARAHKRTRLRAIVRTCRAARRAAVLKARAIRAGYRAAAAQEVTKLYSRGRRDCESAKIAAVERAGDSLGRATAALDTERKHQATVRRYAKPSSAMLGRKPARARARAIERVQESDDEVRANLPDDLIPVFDAVRRKIAANPRRSRTETFLEWAAENASDVYALQNAQLERDIADLVEREAELRERSSSPKYYRQRAAAELHDVPF